MKNAAAITAQLVDMRNVGTHKVLKLTLHVPEEQALKAIAVFGWPTGVNPVAVAIAALDLTNVAGEPASLATREADGDLGGPSATVSRSRKPVAADKRLAQQAGIACSDELFRKFLREQCCCECDGADDAAKYVRKICGVASRSEIKVGTPEGEIWQELYGDFLVWRDLPEMADCQGERV
jgi:hypothetical protein